MEEAEKTLTYILLISESDELASAISEQVNSQADVRFERISSLDRKLEKDEAEVIPDIVLTGIVRSSKEIAAINRSLESFGWDRPLIAIVPHDCEAEVEGPFIIQAPFRCSQLLRTINSARTRTVTERDALWMISGCKYYPGEKQLVNGSDAVFRITEKEAAILVRLYKADGAPVSREDLLRDLWGYHAEAETHTVETHIYRLRQKLERDPTQAKILVTDVNGYRLNRGS